MPQLIACPDAHMLKKIALGDLPPADAHSLFEHLANCSDCANRLGSIVADDPLVAAVRSKQDMPEQEAVRKLLEKVRGLVAETHSQDGNQTVALDSPASANSQTGVLSSIDSPQAEEPEDDGLAPPQAADEIGRLGTYRILKVLGEGGMGKVFLAEDAALQRPVALKVMKKSLAGNLNARKRFLQEARTAAKIEHDNIVPIFQVGEDRGVPFLAMPLLKGMSFEDMLRRSAPLQLKQTLRIGIQVAEGLTAAHASNLIHRDIKPGNIWIEPTAGGRVKILDFGLARPSESDTGLTQSGAIVGTPAYMSPEQARGDKVDHRADLYSLGVVLYRMSTGQLPLKGNDTMAMLTALATQEPAAPCLVKPTLPPALSDLIMRLLAKDAGKRPSSAKEVVQTLKAIERGDVAPVKNDTAVLSEPKLQPVANLSDSTVTLAQRAAHEVSGTANPLTARASPPRRRRPALLIAYAAAAFCLLLGLGGGIFYIVTDNGTIEIKTVDKNIKIMAEENGGKVTIMDPASKQTWVLNTGKYTLKLDGNPASLEIELPADRTFEMKRGGKQVVSIRRYVGPVAKVEPPADAKRVTPDGAPIKEPAAGSSVLSVEENGSVAFAKRIATESTSFTLEGWWLVRPTNNWMRWRLLGTDAPSLGFDAREGFYYLPSAKASPLMSKATSSGRWTHVACVTKGKEARLFVDGKIAATATIEKENTLQQFNPALVCRVYSPKEVRISSVARYDKDFTPAKRFEPDKDTLALYHCDEGAGDELKDSSGNGHHGKIVGAKWVKVDEAPIAHSPGPWQPVLDTKLSQWWLQENKEPEPIAVVNVEGEPALRLRPGIGKDPVAVLAKQLRSKNQHLRLEFRFPRSGNLVASFSLDEETEPQRSDSWVRFNLNKSNNKQTHVELPFAKANMGQLKDGAIVSKSPIKHEAMFAPPAGQWKWLDAFLYPDGQWNRLDLLWADDRMALFINGRLLGALTDVRGVSVIDGKEMDPARTALSLQCQFGEVLIRRAEIRPITAFQPEAFGMSFFPPLDPAWVKAVARMKSDKQVDAVKAELMKRNQGFDGNLKFDLHKDGSVLLLRIPTDNVGDISPVRVFEKLGRLECGGSAPGKGKLADLTSLNGMKSLDTLIFPNTEVADLTPLSNLPGLRELNLTYTKVDDAGLAQIANIKSLRMLQVAGQLQISDAGIASLVKMTGLEYLNVNKTEISPKGVEALRKALPKCRIEQNDGVIEP